MPRYKQRINGDRLARARARAGLLQADLAREVDSHARVISQLETGDGNASPKRVRRLAEALGVSTGYLYGDGADDWPPLPADERAHT